MPFTDRIVLDDLEQQIFDELSKMPVIDAHEHLKSEKEFLSTRYDWAWAIQYVINDLRAAGLDQSFDIYDNSLSPAEKWAKVKPFWPAARWGTPARMFRFSLREWFGFDDITDDNFELLGQKLNANTRPGFYKTALTDKCHVQCAISNGRNWKDYADALVRVIVNIPRLTGPVLLQEFSTSVGLPIRNDDDLRQALRKYFDDALAAGVVGFKTVAYPLPRYTASAMPQIVADLAAGQRLADGQWQQMLSYVHDLSFDIIRPTDKVVAVHCGCWTDYRETHTVNFYEVMLEHPGIRFDLFHMGMPSPRQSVLVGKYLPNAVHNLAGALLFSQHMFESALQEYLDIVPASKFIGFGGDFQWRPELVWGHLQLQMESYARVFAARIRRGMIDMDSSLETLHSWMYENPKRYYRL